MTKNSLRKIPFLSGTLKRVEANVEQFGIQEALRRLSDGVNAKLEVCMSKKTRRILAKERVIVIANHPTDTEPVAIFAGMPPRRDAKLIVSDCMANLSRAVDEHLIPVHVRLDKIHSPVGWRPLAFLANITSANQDMTSEEAHNFNINQMRLASQELAKGSLIMIFPGKRIKDGRWFPGVGHLLSEAKTDEPIYVVNAHVVGTSHWDFVRFVPQLGKVMPPIQVTFSEPFQVNALKKKSGKAIAHVLEKRYESWSESLLIRSSN